jgi:dihydrodipicolinate reductase
MHDTAISVSLFRHCISGVSALMQAIVPLEVAEAVGGFKELTPSGTSVLLEGQLAETPQGTKQASSCLKPLMSHSNSQSAVTCVS